MFAPYTSVIEAYSLYIFILIPCHLPYECSYVLLCIWPTHVTRKTAIRQESLPMNREPTRLTMMGPGVRGEWAIRRSYNVVLWLNNYSAKRAEGSYTLRPLNTCTAFDVATAHYGLNNRLPRSTNQQRKWLQLELGVSYCQLYSQLKPELVSLLLTLSCWLPFRAT